MSKISEEPVAIGSAVAWVLSAAVSLGLGLTVDQVLAVQAAVTAVVALVVRSKVEPFPPKVPDSPAGL